MFIIFRCLQTMIVAVAGTADHGAVETGATTGEEEEEEAAALGKFPPKLP